MKRTDEIVGLPIVSISEGIEVGKVRDVIVNADKGAVDYILVDSGIQMISARVIPTTSIVSIGEDALTINNDQSISDISKVSEALELLQKNISIRGSRVLTKSGRLLGEIGNIYVDEEDCCNILALEYIGNANVKRTQVIPRSCIITFGKKMIVVTDDIEYKLLDSALQLCVDFSELNNKCKDRSDFDSNERITKNDKDSFKKNASSVNQNPLNNTAGFMEASLEAAAHLDNHSNVGESVEDEDIIVPAYLSDDEITDLLNVEDVDFTESEEEPLPNLESKANPTKNDAADLFEQKQRQYLIGKKATKTITDTLGEIIIKEGSQITESIIDVAKSQGKLVELVMNNTN